VTPEMTPPPESQIPPTPRYEGRRERLASEDHFEGGKQRHR
jgi:hypothetical protein